MMKKKIIIIWLLLKVTISYNQDLNLSFENIDSSGFLVGWIRLAERITDDAYEGRKAVKVFTHYSNLRGILSIGNLYDPIKGRSTQAGVSFTKKPIKLKGYYKYEYGQNCGGKDSGDIHIYLKKYNNQSKRTDTIGIGKIVLGPSAVYKLFEVPISYRSAETPDSLLIDIISDQFYSKVFCEFPTNRFLTVDALSFDFATPTEEHNLLKSPITIHPNPTSNNVSITWGENAVSDVLLKDILGQTLQKKAINTEGVELDLSTLPTGVYFVEFKQNGQHLATRKVVKQ
jgi:Secretion system C-terminal sorting domain/Putative carbohydrate metabolism domain